MDKERGRNRVDIGLLAMSRGTRSVAAGVLSVVVGLYYKNQLHLPLTLIGLLFAVGALFTPVATSLLGRVADLRGRKRVMLLSLLFFPVAILILLTTDNLLWLALSAALGGFGIAGGLVGGGIGATVAPMQVALLAEKTTNENRVRVFSAFTILSTLAGAGGALLANVSNYDMLFAVALLLSGASFLSVLPLQETYRPSRVPRKEGKSVPVDRKYIRAFMATGALNGASQGLIISFLPIILQVHFGLSNGAIGNLFATGGVLTAVAMLFTPYLTAKLGFLRLIMTTRGVAACATLLFPFSLGATMAAGVYLLFTMFRAVSLPSQQSLMMNLVGEGSRATATGMNQSARLLPSAGATLASGIMQDTLPILVPFELATLLSGANIFLYQHFFGKIPEANRHSPTPVIAE